MKKLLYAVLVLMTGHTTAQAESYHLNDTSRVHDLDEVFVIRQPKEQYRLRLQPVSSTMLSGQNLGVIGARDLREMSAYVPNFTMPNYGSRYTSAIYVRGIGSRINSPAVGIYVDGMPVVNKSAFNTHTYDLARVDILRGPQGTLYGLNSEAGLVRLYTKNPMDYQGTELSMGIGTHFYRNVQLSHYQKINNKMAFSIAGFYNGQNGFFTNQTLGKKADKYNEAGGRMKFVFRPTARWDINLTADYQHTRQNAFPYGLVGSDGIAEDPTTNLLNNYRRHTFSTALDIHYQARDFDIASTTSYQYLNDRMLMDIDYLPLDFMKMTEQQVGNAITQELTFKSRKPVGGFWRWTAGAFGSVSWLRTNSAVDFGQDMDDFLGTTIRNAMYNAMVSSMAARFIARGMTADVAQSQAEAIIAQAGGVTMTTDMREVPGLFHTPTYNLGLYHESNFDITPRLMATVGVRYDWSRQSISYNTGASIYSLANVMGQQAAVTVTSLLDSRTHENFGQLLPKLGLTYQLSDDGSNIYATVSKGYRAGGYNIQMFSDILSTEIQSNSSQRADYTIPHTQTDYDNINRTIAYKPETSWNYEVGTHLNLFGHKVQLDLGAFYMQIRNQQISKMAGNYGFGRMMTNAGRSTSCGVEATLRGQALDDHLSWQVSYGYTRARFADYSDTLTVGGSTTVVDYKDNHVPFVPEHTLAATTAYRFDFATGSLLRSATVGADVTAQGKTYWDEANTLSQKFYAVLGARLGLDFGQLSVDLWGRNLTSTRYNVFAVSSSATGAKQWFAQRGNPIQVGADVKVKF
ncbi:MAG: TonB-dependent receptor [Prevotella sp.]|nr:TonB-dependent receptor [Prevotella sp.]